MQNLSDIIRSQTNLKGIDKDLNRLKKIQSIWLKLINTPSKNSQIITSTILEKSIPIRVYGNTLNIACENALLANHLRYNKEALIQLLAENGINNIDVISLSVSQDIWNQNQFQKGKIDKIKRTVDPDTITNLEHFLNSCQSEQLSLSIKKLLEQLKKTS